MKKTKYITKYDYMSYYVKPQYLWFLNSLEIESILATGIKVFKNLSDGMIDYRSHKKELLNFAKNDLSEIRSEIDLDENENDENFSDTSVEFDSYEYFKEMKEELDETVKNNAKIVEGNIIDLKTKEHIKKTYQTQNTFVCDFEDKSFKWMNDDDKITHWKTLLSNHKDLILFQPTFIFGNKITRPDAIVIQGKTLTLIETKGTSTCKIIHFLDLLFQKKVVEKIAEFKGFSFSYNLCIVEYEKLKTNEISFAIIDTINLKKNPAFSKSLDKFDSYEEYLSKKRDFKQGLYYDKNDSQCWIPINEILSGNYGAIDEMLESNTINPISKKSFEKEKSLVRSVLNEFDDVVDLLAEDLEKKQKLWNSEQESVKEDALLSTINCLFPSIQDQNRFKNSDFFPVLKQIYVYRNLENFKFSGNVTVQSEKEYSKLIEELKSTNFEYLKPLFKEPKGDLQRYHNFFAENTPSIWINQFELNNFFSKIKRHQVYFDFETINTAIRAVDDSLPFTQVVTQCSILKLDGKTNEESECLNLIIDPQKINVEWYKEIIDSLYYDPNNNNQTSYLVYNVSFERSRLKEISNYLDNEYKIKINKIIDNIVDLADVFKIQKGKKPFLFLKNLFGFYSIKKVLPLIETNYPIAFKQAKCVDYKTLEVGNGKICQDTTALRFFKIMGDEEWNEISIQLQKYCENDVRAMYAIYLWIKTFIDNQTTNEKTEMINCEVSPYLNDSLTPDQQNHDEATIEQYANFLECEEFLEKNNNSCLEDHHFNLELYESEQDAICAASQKLYKKAKLNTNKDHTQEIYKLDHRGSDGIERHYHPFLLYHQGTTQYTAFQITSIKRKNDLGETFYFNHFESDQHVEKFGKPFLIELDGIDNFEGKSIMNGRVGYSFSKNKIYKLNKECRVGNDHFKNILKKVKINFEQLDKLNSLDHKTFNKVLKTLENLKAKK